MRRYCLLLVFSVGVVLGPQPEAAADGLRLAPGLSFTDDSSDAFPIVGDHLDHAAVGEGRATLAFFGASHCWNTNREAERVVAVYPRFRDRVNFIIVDVNHPSDAQRPLLATHYHGYIPTVVVLAPNGAVLYAKSGETASTRGDTQALEALLRTAIGDDSSSRPSHAHSCTEPQQ